MIRRLYTVFFICFLFLAQSVLLVHGSPTAEKHEADKIFLAASACVASYSGRPGRLAADYLSRLGWEIEPYEVNSNAANARFLILKNIDYSEGEAHYMLAFTGTETIKDVYTDLRAHKVHFGGRNEGEFVEYAAHQDVPSTEPQIHRGFHDQVMTALQARTAKRDGAERLVEKLLDDPHFKVCLTGHSMGGAAATLAAARLISAGVSPDQLTVITFGAPAVGNKAFAARFEHVINLQRIIISGDMVTGLLQTFAAGYDQFGRQITWVTPNYTTKGPHNMLQYMDLALKHYYDAVPFRLPSKPEKRPDYYVGSVKLEVVSHLAVEEKYLARMLAELYHSFPASKSVPAVDFSAALAAGAKYVLLPEVKVHLVRDQKDLYYVTITETVYETESGRLAHMATFSANTQSLTPLEALGHVYYGALDVRNERLSTAASQVTE